MRLYTLPDNEVIDLDAVIRVGTTFINKNYPEHNCYEIYLSNGASFGVFDNQLSRSSFITEWGGS
jgi:hypothetical protein